MIKLAGRTVGDGNPCFITFEAGPTHNGLDSAKELVRLAAEAGADAVKFQIIDPDRLVQDRQMLFEYEILVDAATGQRETVKEPLYDILCRRALSNPEWEQVRAEARAANIAFFATIGFEDEIAFLQKLDCDSVKIASVDVNHHPLLRQVARTGMCVQIDTGSATLGEIEQAVDIMQAEGNDRIIIHHCPSGYPARIESINLRVLPTLKTMFGLPVAYSDHTPGWEMDVAALALGANLIEKTITKDRTTRSVEHIMSIEPDQMQSFIGVVREVELGLGQSRRVMQPAKYESRIMGRRSAFVKAGGKAGQPLSELEIEFRRPGTGIAPDEFEALAARGLCLRADCPPDHKLKVEDLTG